MTLIQWLNLDQQDFQGYPQMIHKHHKILAIRTVQNAAEMIYVLELPYTIRAEI
jgi:hypothetical protein